MKNLLKIKHMDKVFHFVAGAIITLIASIFVAPLVAWGIGFVAGLAKEVYDLHSGKGVNSWADWFATIAGSSVIYFLI